MGLVDRFFIEISFSNCSDTHKSANLRQLTGSEDLSYVSFDSFGKYLEMPKQQRLTVPGARLVWKSILGAFRIADILAMSGKFAWKRLFSLIKLAQSSGFIFRIAQVETGRLYIIRMHFNRSEGVYGPFRVNYTVATGVDLIHTVEFPSNIPSSQEVDCDEFEGDLERVQKFYIMLSFSHSIPIENKEEFRSVTGGADLFNMDFHALVKYLDERVTKCCKISKNMLVFFSNEGECQYASLPSIHSVLVVIAQSKLFQVRVSQYYWASHSKCELYIHFERCSDFETFRPMKIPEVSKITLPSSFIHEEEYVRSLKARHMADVDEFECSIAGVWKFYVKLSFSMNETSRDMDLFRKSTGGEDPSNMDFDVLAKYLNKPKNQRCGVVQTMLVWKTKSGANRIADLHSLSGGFEWAKVFALIRLAQSKGFEFRLAQYELEGNSTCILRMHLERNALALEQECIEAKITATLEYDPSNGLIHLQEYPIDFVLEGRHGADVDEFECTIASVWKFYVKLSFSKNKTSRDMDLFRKSTGGEDPSNMDFDVLAKYLNKPKNQRCGVVQTMLVWKTKSGANRIADLHSLSGGFEWAKVFALIRLAQSKGFEFRLAQYELNVNLNLRMHFQSKPMHSKSSFNLTAKDFDSDQDCRVVIKEGTKHLSFDAALLSSSPPDEAPDRDLATHVEKDAAHIVDADGKSVIKAASDDEKGSTVCFNCCLCS